MWSELFLLNKDALLRQMEKFSAEFSDLYEILKNGDEQALKEKMRQSTARRALFNKATKEDEQE